MLSSVLNSDRAIEVNIKIMRTFVKLQEMIVSHKDLSRKLNELEKKYDENFKVVFETIRALMARPETPKKKIGFNLKEPKAGYRSSPSPSTGESRGGGGTRKDQSARIRKTTAGSRPAKKCSPGAPAWALLKGTVRHAQKHLRPLPSRQTKGGMAAAGGAFEEGGGDGPAVCGAVWGRGLGVSGGIVVQKRDFFDN